MLQLYPQCVLLDFNHLKSYGPITKSHFCINEMYFGLEIDKLLNHHV
jgi:hypothetical protein